MMTPTRIFIIKVYHSGAVESGCYNPASDHGTASTGKRSMREIFAPVGATQSPIAETHGLWKSYGAFGALRGLDLSVPEGSVFALLGENGAGKTTAIKCLMNIVTPTRGSARVLGVDSGLLGPSILAQIGYVSENQELPNRLRVDAFFRFVRSCYPGWDHSLEERMRSEFRLPGRRRIGALSHGMRLKLTLACALAFHPRLLILDEPFSGLDPLVRDEIVEGFIGHRGELSIIISSHELDELERVATHAAFLHRGQLLVHGPLTALRERAGAVAGKRAASLSLRDAFISMARSASGADSPGALSA